MISQPQTGALIEFGPFRFDKSLGKLSKHDTPIRLRGMPLKILQQLVERPGEVVSRGELQTLLWKGVAFGGFEQGLNTAVNVVRKTLCDSAVEARYIETVPGEGYRFVAPIRSGLPITQSDMSTATDLARALVDTNGKAGVRFERPINGDSKARRSLDGSLLPFLPAPFSSSQP